MDYLHTVWLKYAELTPESVAIEDVSGKYTYKELADKANQWCNYFQMHNVRKKDHVVLIADSSFASISLLAGCSLSGAVFTVISPETPITRRNTIIEDVQPKIIAYDNNTIDLNLTTDIFERDQVVNRFMIEKKISDHDKNNDRKESSLLSVDPAYIVFTSGTTGKPKGIVMSHGAVASFWQGLIEHADLLKNKRFVSLSPLQFDFSLLDIGLCLGSGAALILPNRGLLRKPKQLVSELCDSEVTHISGVPTIWKILLQTAGDLIHKLDKLELIVFAGEHFPAENMCKISDAIPGIEFYNIYGQSESIACTFHVVKEEVFRKENAVIPVGKSHRDMELFIVDYEGNEITDVGVHGELYIKGSTLFSGYWKHPELTEKCLMQNPMHNEYVEMVFKTGDICYYDDAGLFYFIGRKDNQIKINGNRVELEEIETALNRHPGIINSCAIMHEDILHAALIMSPTDDVIDSSDESSLRSFLNEGLPSYMLPKHYHFLKSMPVSENGKNDRKKLIHQLGLS